MTDEMNWMDNRLEINFDAGVRCALQCSKCMRRHYPDKLDKKVTGHDTSLEDFQKIIVLCHPHLANHFSIVNKNVVIVCIYKIFLKN